MNYVLNNYICRIGTSEDYNSLEVKDPSTIYIVRDQKKVFLGDQEYPNDHENIKGPYIFANYTLPDVSRMKVGVYYIKSSVAYAAMYVKVNGRLETILLKEILEKKDEFITPEVFREEAESRFKDSKSQDTYVLSRALNSGSSVNLFRDYYCNDTILVSNKSNVSIKGNNCKVVVDGFDLISSVSEGLSITDTNQFLEKVIHTGTYQLKYENSQWWIKNISLNSGMDNGPYTNSGESGKVPIVYRPVSSLEDFHLSLSHLPYEGEELTINVSTESRKCINFYGCNNISIYDLTTETPIEDLMYKPIFAGGSRIESKFELIDKVSYISTVDSVLLKFSAAVTYYGKFSGTYHFKYEDSGSGLKWNAYYEDEVSPFATDIDMEDNLFGLKYTGPNYEELGLELEFSLLYQAYPSDGDEGLVSTNTSGLQVGSEASNYSDKIFIMNYTSINNKDGIILRCCRNIDIISWSCLNCKMPFYSSMTEDLRLDKFRMILDPHNTMPHDHAFYIQYDSHNYEISNGTIEYKQERAFQITPIIDLYNERGYDHYSKNLHFTNVNVEGANILNITNTSIETEYQCVMNNCTFTSIRPEDDDTGASLTFSASPQLCYFNRTKYYNKIYSLIGDNVTSVNIKITKTSGSSVWKVAGSTTLENNLTDSDLLNNYGVGVVKPLGTETEIISYTIAPSYASKRAQHQFTVPVTFNSCTFDTIKFTDVFNTSINSSINISKQLYKFNTDPVIDRNAFLNARISDVGLVSDNRGQYRIDYVPSTNNWKMRYADNVRTVDNIMFTTEELLEIGILISDETVPVSGTILVITLDKNVKFTFNGCNIKSRDLSTVYNNATLLGMYGEFYFNNSSLSWPGTLRSIKTTSDCEAMTSFKSSSVSCTRIATNPLGSRVKFEFINSRITTASDVLSTNSSGSFSAQVSNSTFSFSDNGNHKFIGPADCTPLSTGSYKSQTSGSYIYSSTLGVYEMLKFYGTEGDTVDIVTSLTSDATDSQVPSAKCMYDAMSRINSLITEIRGV